MNLEFLILNSTRGREPRPRSGRFGQWPSWRNVRRTVFALIVTISLSQHSFAGDPTATPTLDAPTTTVTVIPNPVRGKKVTFRVLTDRAVKVRIRVYNRFLDTVVEFEKEGDKLFDVLWPLRKIPEGIYYYQVQVTDTKTGTITSLSVQKFVILKASKPAQM